VKTYIVLPFKDRSGKYKKALDEFINPFINHIQNCLDDFEIIIVEQLGGSLNTSLPQYYSEIISDRDEEFFNLGRTINIGFDYLSSKIKDDDIFIFHPVDLLPIDVDYKIYQNTKFCYRDHSPDGAFYKSIGFISSEYKKINGFSNNYWGWGLEDDDLFTRISIHGISFDKKIDNYTRLTNDGNGVTDDEHYMPLYNFNQQFVYHIRSTKDYNISGLNNLRYEVVETEFYNGIKKIKII
jgi:beta-1,4-galactosyltransferase 1